MYWFLLACLSISTAVEPPDAPESPPEEQEESSPSEDIQECQKASQELKNSVVGLELYLKDKKEYKTYCPYVAWEQPSLEIYKEDPKSYLPEECKEEKI